MSTDNTEPAPELFVGIDWATKDNQVCVRTRDDAVIGEQNFPNDGAGLAEMCTWLCALVGATPSRIWVAIEVPHGPVVETLIERGFIVHSINPKQLDRFRDRFGPSGAKDDRRDANVLASAIRTDARAFRRLRLDDPSIIEMREYSRMAGDLKTDRNRLTNRVRQQLRRYYPQMLELGDDPGADWFLRLFALAPTPAHAEALELDAVDTLLRKHRIRRIDAAGVHEILGREPLHVAPGTAQAARAHIEQLAERIYTINRQIKHTHRMLDELTLRLTEARPDDDESLPSDRAEQHDAEILRSMPGIGRIVLAVLLTEASQPIADRDYHALRALCGVAPVTRSSGKSRVVIMRTACPPRLRDAVYHWARVASQHDPTAKRSYANLRARGHSHGRALRSVGDRLLRIACAMLRDGTTYDPQQGRARIARNQAA